MRLSLTRISTIVLAAGAVALGLAACGGSNNSGGDSAQASMTPAGARSGVVSIQSVDGTRVLTDSTGRTLYSAQVEKGGRIHCTGACTSFWKPVAATASQSSSAAGDLGLDLGVVKRPDGQRQLTLKGQPLYTFTQEGPGQLQGDGFTDDFGGTHFEWSAATAGGGSSTTGSSGSSGGSSGSSGGSGSYSAY